jgi:hypothetical protein
MENRLSFGKIHVIEWLWKINPETNQPDRRTGAEVYHAAKRVIAESGTRMDIILHRVSSRASFLERLHRIEQDFLTTRRIPLLQIETHGDLDGIGLTDDNGLTWPELMNVLTPLNTATGVRLPVILSACHGVWGIKMAQPVERAPFLALLGPNRKVYPGEVVRGMTEFYRGVFVHKSGDRAMQLLNNVVDPDRTTFGIYNCERLFTDVWNGYLEEVAKQGVAETRVDRMMTMGRLTYGPLPRHEETLARQRMHDYIADQPARFEESRRHFFMIDLFPENGARFNLTVTPLVDKAS